MDRDIAIDIAYSINCIRDSADLIVQELRRFNDREEAKQPKLPEGWMLDIPMS